MLNLRILSRATVNKMRRNMDTHTHAGTVEIIMRENRDTWWRDGLLRKAKTGSGEIKSETVPRRATRRENEREKRELQVDQYTHRYPHTGACINRYTHTHGEQREKKKIDGEHTRLVRFNFIRGTALSTRNKVCSKHKRNKIIFAVELLTL